VSREDADGYAIHPAMRRVDRRDIGRPIILRILGTPQIEAPPSSGAGVDLTELRA